MLVELGLLERARAHRRARRAARPRGRRPRASSRSIREVVTLLPEDDARRLARDADRTATASRIEVAVADPLGREPRKQLIELLGSLGAHQARGSQPTSSGINKIVRARRPISATRCACSRRKLESRKASKGTERSCRRVVDENAPVVKVVNLILEQAVRDRASDVHIEPMADIGAGAGAHRRRAAPGHDAARPDGPVAGQPHQGHVRHEHRRAPHARRTARWRSRSADRELDVRVSTTPTVFGEKCVMRVLDKTTGRHRAARRSAWRPRPTPRYYDLIRSPYGMVICAGPTGSGQDDDAVRDPHRDQQRRHQRRDDRGPGRVRLPDDQPDPDQRAGGPDVRRRRCVRSCARTPTRSSSARSATSRPRASRRRPRSPVTSSCRRCTRPTRRSALHRFMDMGIEPFLVASSLLGVVGQRLDPQGVRALHRAVQADARGARVLRARRRSTPTSATSSPGVGCNFCGQTGYYDRIGIYEVLRGDRRDEGAHRRPTRRTPSCARSRSSRA